MAIDVRHRRRTEVSDGRGEPLRELYEVQYRPLVRLAALLLDDPGACEEVVQDAFVQAIVHWDAIRDPGRAPAWLRSAVLNGARSRLRRRLVVRRHPVADPGPVASGEAGADEHDRVTAALRRLPPRQREALVLRYYLDLAEADIARTMGVSAGSVKVHLHRGLHTLTTLLEDSP
jgi:RNA polymerase sigma-70 factor (sigma-E family)